VQFADEYRHPNCLPVAYSPSKAEPFNLYRAIRRGPQREPPVSGMGIQCKAECTHSNLASWVQATVSDSSQSDSVACSACYLGGPTESIIAAVGIDR
jgi:hypothetical protein